MSKNAPNAPANDALPAMPRVLDAASPAFQRRRDRVWVRRARSLMRKLG